MHWTPCPPRGEGGVAPLSEWRLQTASMVLLTSGLWQNSSEWAGRDCGRGHICECDHICGCDLV